MFLSNVLSTKESSGKGGGGRPPPLTVEDEDSPDNVVDDFQILQVDEVNPNQQQQKRLL